MEETTESNSQQFGFYLVNTGSDFITASLAISIEGISLLYVASNGAIELVGLLYYILAHYAHFSLLVRSDNNQHKQSNWCKGGHH